MANGAQLKKNGFIAKLQQARDGAAKFLPKGTSLVLNGQSMTVEQLIAGFDAELTKAQASDSAKAQYQATVQAVRSGLPAAREMYLALKKWAELNFAKGDARLTEFGFPVRKPKVPSSETRLVAKVKAARTRAARHTMGSQQRLALTADPAPRVVVLGPDGLPLGESVPAPPANATPGPAKV